MTAPRHGAAHRLAPIGSPEADWRTPPCERQDITADPDWPDRIDPSDWNDSAEALLVRAGLVKP